VEPSKERREVYVDCPGKNLITFLKTGRSTRLPHRSVEIFLSAFCQRSKTA
jgi:hypothetical protein